jgi:hypothetical protein
LWGRRITSERRGSFVLAGSNFFDRPIEPTEPAWKKDIAILVAEHEAWRSAVARLPQQSNKQKDPPSVLHLVRGAAAHDLYHAGQIRLLRRRRLQA